MQGTSRYRPSRVPFLTIVLLMPCAATLGVNNASSLTDGTLDDKRLSFPLTDTGKALVAAKDAATARQAIAAVSANGDTVNGDTVINGNLTIKKVLYATQSIVVVQDATGNDYVLFKDNTGKSRGIIAHDFTSDVFFIRKFAARDGTSVAKQLELRDNGVFVDGFPIMIDQCMLMVIHIEALTDKEKGL